jgi:hypothetical protein
MKLHGKSLGSFGLVLGLSASAPFTNGVVAVTSVCSLVTRPEAAAALGAAVPAGSEKAINIPMKGGGSIMTTSCFYGTEVSVSRFDLGSSAAKMFGQYRQSLADRSDYQNVKGVGDEAFFAKGQLALRKGQTGLIIDVGQARGGGKKEENAEKGLAVRAVGRL